MLKAFLVLSALLLFELTFASGPALAGVHTPQDAAAAPAAQSAPAPAAPAAQSAPAQAAPASTNPVKSTAASRERAKKLYSRDCAYCHGDNGNGKTDLSADLKMSDWTDPATLAPKSDQALFDAIRKGTAKMPPEEEGRATKDEVWNLVLYIRGMSKGQAAEAHKPAN